MKNLLLYFQTFSYEEHFFNDIYEKKFQNAMSMNISKTVKIF